MKDRPGEANGQKDQGAGQEVLGGGREEAGAEGVCVGWGGGGGRSETEQGKPVDKSSKGARRMLHAGREREK
uniref:Uncharacterized protein n=1 Tax=Oncorhynchus tshawytscha TaxID=74940 RepID=A0AAZ3NXK2_ONCTS